MQRSNCCFLCLRNGHAVKNCGSKLSCPNCGEKHNVVLCRKVAIKEAVDEVMNGDPSLRQDEVLTNFAKSGNVLLQTLSVILRGAHNNGEVRAIIDTGSHRSYILKNTAIKMGYEVSGYETLRHSLFGGTCKDISRHEDFRAYFSNLSQSYNSNFEVLGQGVIRETAASVAEGPGKEVLIENGIDIIDACKGPIEILIGANVAGKLLTGCYKNCSQAWWPYRRN